MGRPEGSQSRTVETEHHVWRWPLRWPNGRWAVRVRDKRTAKVTLRFLDAETEVEAKRERDRLVQQEEDVRQKMAQPADERAAGGLTVRVVFDRWLKTIEVREVTHRNYVADVGKYGRDLGEHKLASEVTLADAEALFMQTWKGMGGRNRIKHRHQLVRIWSWLQAHGDVKDNPFQKLQVPRKWKDENRASKEGKGQALTHEEAVKLVDACTGPLRLFVQLGLRSGLRKSNILGSRDKSGLCWCDIDLEKRTVKLPATQMKNGLDFTAPLHDELVFALKAQRDSLSEIKLDGPIVEGLRYPEKRFESALKRAGLAAKELRIHDLRHTFATWLSESCTEAVCAQLLGHAKRTITQRYSMHQRLETLREGINRLPWLTTGQPTASKAVSS